MKTSGFQAFPCIGMKIRRQASLSRGFQNWSPLEREVGHVCVAMILEEEPLIHINEEVLLQVNDMLTQKLLNYQTIFALNKTSTVLNSIGALIVIAHL